MRAHKCKNTSFYCKMLWSLVIAFSISIPSFAQNAKEKQLLEIVIAQCDKAMQLNDSKEKYFTILKCLDLHDSILQEIIERERIAVFKEIDKLDTEISQQDILLEETRKQTQQLQAQNDCTMMTLHKDFLKTQLEEEGHKEKSIMLAKKEAQNDSILTAMEYEAKKSQSASSTMKLILGFMLAIFITIVYIALRIRHTNRKMALATSDMETVRQKATAADNMKTYFIQNLSHEIRTPLNAIVGFSDLLVRPGVEMSDEEAQSITKLISSNSEQLTTLVSDILDVSNLQSGQVKLRLEEYHVNEVLQYALKTVEGREEEGVKLYWTSDVDDNHKLYTDVTRLRQLLVNYLTNACKYTSQGEIHLHCSTSEIPGSLVFSVTDTGSGVPKDQAEAVFSRFEMLNSMKQGTGLGLNICRLIAQNLNGEVWLDTNYEQGARFMFSHPINLKERHENENNRINPSDTKSSPKGKALMLAVCFMLGSLSAQAQNNIFKIKDSDYEAYKQLESNYLNNPRLSHDIDSLAKDAHRRKEWKAEILFYTIGVHHAYDNIEEKRRYLVTIRELATKHNLLQYYFWSYSSEITTLLNNNKHYEALKQCDFLGKEADRFNDNYGKALYLHNVGKTYYHRGYYKAACGYYERSYEFILHNVPSQDPTSGTSEYVTSLTVMGVPTENILEMLEERLKNTKSVNNQSMIRVLICRCLFLLGRYDEFMEEFESIEKTYPQLYLTQYFAYFVNKSFYYNRKGQYDEAINNMKDKEDYRGHLRQCAAIYAEQGNYEKACSLVIQYHKNIHKKFIPDTLSFYEKFITERQMRQQQMAKEKAQLELQNKQAILLAKMLADSIEVDSLRQQQLEEEQRNERNANEVKLLQQENRKKLNEVKMEDNVLKYQLMVISIVGFMLLSVMLGAYLYVITRKRKQIKTAYYYTKNAMKMAQESDKQQTEFIHRLSHEIRTPLNAIVGFSSLLSPEYREMLSEEERINAISRIRENTTLLSGFINDILETSRLESGKTTIKKVNANVHQLCMNVVTRHQYDKDTVSVEYVDKLPVDFSFETDLQRFDHMLEKIVGNATKFTDKGYVRVTTKPIVASSKQNDESHKLLVIIEDTGIGIPVEKKDEVFQKFTKIDAFMPGTGMGLPLAHITAEKLGGTITLDTDYKLGARFIIKL